MAQSPCPPFERVAIIGCGLMGGSLALALKAQGMARHVVGFSPSPSSRQSAMDVGAIDSACTDIASAVAGADLVVMAVPVGAIANTLRAISPALAAEALLIDLGSTKQDVVDAACEALTTEQRTQFVPCHPIAGKEKAGVSHAEATLYQHRLTVLTPTPQTDPNHTSRARDLWHAVGSRINEMTPQQHDHTYAAVSHLPHLLAFAAVNAIDQQEQADQLMAAAGPGFRDFSRIAASDPVVWRDILLTNRLPVLAQLALYQDALKAFRSALQAGDAAALQTLITQARDRRAPWSLDTPNASLSDGA